MPLSFGFIFNYFQLIYNLKHFQLLLLQWTKFINKELSASSNYLFLDNITIKGDFLFFRYF